MRTTDNARCPQGQAPRTLATLLAIESDECVLWPHSTSSGYGTISVARGRWKYVHVLACSLRHGDRPTTRHEVAHSCGNPPCLNYRHLRWATPAENAADRVLHGTDARGDRCSTRKLSAAQVRVIRRLLADGANQHETGRRFGVTQSAISSIARGKSWRFVQ